MTANGTRPDSSKSSSHSSSASSAAVDLMSGVALMVESGAPSPPSCPNCWVCFSFTVAFGRGFALPGSASGVVCFPTAGPAGDAGALARGMVFAPTGGAAAAGSWSRCSGGSGSL